MLHGEGLYHSRHGEDDRTKKTAWPVYVKEESDFHWALARILGEDMAPMRAVFKQLETETALWT